MSGRRMTLVEWHPIDNAGAKIGRARVLLPIGLEIGDIGIFEKDGQPWAQLPSQPMRDRDGKPFTGPDGKTKWLSPLKWSTRELQNGWSVAVLALIDGERGFGPREPAAPPTPQRRSSATIFPLNWPRPATEPLPNDGVEDLWGRDDGGTR